MEGGSEGASLCVLWREVSGARHGHLTNLLAYLVAVGPDSGLQHLPVSFFDFSESWARMLKFCDKSSSPGGHLHHRGWRHIKADTGPSVSSQVLVCPCSCPLQKALLSGCQPGWTVPTTGPSPHKRQPPLWSSWSDPTTIICIRHNKSLILHHSLWFCFLIKPQLILNLVLEVVPEEQFFKLFLGYLE